jgi:GT2 family glycosyltransferase
MTREINKTRKKSIEAWPKVAIIILNWNGWKDTIECLESVFRNNYANYQVIVLTPESTHPLYTLSHPALKKPILYIYYTLEEVEKGGIFKLEEKINKKWRERRKSNSKELNPTSSCPLIFIQTGKNYGFAGGNNVGIKYAMAKGNYDYIWLLNNDTVIDKDALIEMIKLGKNNKKIGILGSKLLYYDMPNTIQTLGGSNQITWNISGKHICDLKEDRLEYNNDFEIKGYICGASLLAKKKLIEEVGIIDVNYFMLVEDVDWCFRALKKNWKLFYSGKSKVWHKFGAFGASIKKSNVNKKFLGRRSNRFPINKFILNKYYFTRSCLHFAKKYYNKYFVFSCLHMFFKIVIQSIGVLLYDDYKFYRIKILFKGFYDGVIGKTGETIKLNENNRVSKI